MNWTIKLLLLLLLLGSVRQGVVREQGRVSGHDRPMVQEDGRHGIAAGGPRQQRRLSRHRLRRPGDFRLPRRLRRRHLLLVVPAWTQAALRRHGRWRHRSCVVLARWRVSYICSCASLIRTYISSAHVYGSICLIDRRKNAYCT